MKFWKCILALLLLLAPISGHGQFIRYSRFLENEEVMCVATNDEPTFSSQLWVGLSNGFAVLGNRSERRFSSQHTRTGDIPIGAVLHIVAHGPKALLCTESFVLAFDMQKESFNRLTHDGRHVAVISSVQGGAGKYYLLTPDDILLYDFHSSELGSVHHFEQPHDYSYIDLVRAGSMDDDVLILGSDANGIFKFSMAERQISRLDNVPSEIMADLSHFDSLGGLNIVPRSGGIMRFPPGYASGGHILINESSNPPLSNDIIIGIDETEDYLAIATEGASINLVDKASSKVSSVFTSPALQAQRHLLALPGNNFVVGTEFNGVIFCRNSYLSTLSSSGVNPDLNLSNSSVISAYIDHNDHLWIGTDNGINRYRTSSKWGGKVDSFPGTDKFKVTSITGYGNDKILFCATHRGLFLLDKASGAISPFHVPGVVFDSRRNRSLRRKLHASPDGKVLVFNSGEGNHVCYNPATHRLTHIDSEVIGKEEVHHIMGEGQIVVVQTDSSLCEFDCGSLQFRRLYASQGTIQFCCQGQDRNLYFAEKNVIRQYNALTNQVSDVCTLELDGAVIRALCTDSHQNIWATASNGRLYFCDLLDQSVKVFTDTDFDRNIFTSMFSVSNRNRIYLSGALGLMVIDSYAAYEDLEPIHPNVSLISAFVDDESVAIPKAGDKLLMQNNHKSLKVYLNVDNECPLDARLLHIFIRHRGKDIFETVTNRPSFEYFNLPYGKMSLMISTMGKEGWNKEMEVLRIKVKMPFALSGWAISLYILIFLFFMLSVRFFVNLARRRELEETRFELESNKAEEKISLMGSIAHDLRSPMSIVLNRVKSTIEDIKDKPEAAEKLSTTLPQIQKMTEMINMVLSVQKLDNMDQELHFTSVNLNEWVSRAMAEIKPKSDQKGLSLEFVGDSAIQTINTDVGKLTPCLNNLLTNAIKYSDTGTITVSTSLLGKFIRVSVTDEGIGFTSSPDKLFTKFYRENNSYSGYGIGLSYVKSLISKLGGNVGAYHNESGVGSTFYFEIPVMGNEEVSAYTSITRGSGNVMLDTSKYTILVVDDQPDMREMLRDEFVGKFKKVYSAADGMEALLTVRDKKPDMIVSDLKMPRMDGFELCKSVKTDLEISHIPFIMLSSNSEALRRKMSYKTGPDDYLDKPFDAKVLLNLIKGQIKLREDLREQCRSGKSALIYDSQTFSYADEQFILSVARTVKEKELTGRTEIAQEMGISVKTLVRKLDILAGLSPDAYAKRVMETWNDESSRGGVKMSKTTILYKI